MMRKILMLAFAPIRKNKGQTAGLFAFTLITAMFLSIGVVLFFGINNFYDERAEANYAPHFNGIYYSNAGSIEQGLRFMENDSRVADAEKTQALGGFGEYAAAGTNPMNYMLIVRSDEGQKMDAPSFVGEYLPLTGDRIYIPYYIYLLNDFKIGGDFTLFLSGETLTFTIAGALEEISFGSQVGTAFRFYISDERFNELEKQLPESGLSLLSVRLHNGEDTLAFQAAHNNEVSPDGLFGTYTYDDARQARVMIPTIVAGIVIAFAVILLLISLIVIRFRIINDIEVNMTNIGAQKAIGYRNIQINAAIVMQFGLVALAGGIIGVILAGAVIPVLAQVFESFIALIWKPGFNITISVVSILFVLFAVIFIAFMTSRRINRLHPLTALRGGVSSHSFRKNFFPLDTSYGPLNFLLAFKQIMQQKKQAIIISIIVAAVTMSSVAGIAMNYGMNDGQEAFGRSVFGEVAAPEVYTMIKNSDGGEAFKERIMEYPEVRKVSSFEIPGVPILIDGIQASSYISEDCAQMEGEMLVRGIYPRHDNEIALGILILNKTGKRIGDMVTIRADGRENEYLITGILQVMQPNTFIGLMSVDGIRGVMPDFQFANFNIFLHDGADIGAFIERVQADEGDMIGSIVNTREQMSGALEGMGGMFTIVAYGIIAVTVFVVVLTLYMVIKTTILRRRRELGIQKAVGFTTFQLMNQIALNMTPVILLGVTAGAVAGYFGFNPLISAVTSGMGIVRINLPAPVDQIMLACVGLVLLAYAVSMLIAWRIRKISAYAMVNE